MEGTYLNGRFTKYVRCWKCGSRFLSNRSNAIFCSKDCRLAYYRGTKSVRLGHEEKTI